MTVTLGHARSLGRTAAVESGEVHPSRRGARPSLRSPGSAVARVTSQRSLFPKPSSRPVRGWAPCLCEQWHRELAAPVEGTVTTAPPSSRWEAQDRHLGCHRGLVLGVSAALRPPRLPPYPAPPPRLQEQPASSGRWFLGILALRPENEPVPAPCHLPAAARLLSPRVEYPPWRTWSPRRCGHHRWVLSVSGSPRRRFAPPSPGSPHAPRSGVVEEFRVVLGDAGQPGWDASPAARGPRRQQQ